MKNVDNTSFLKTTWRMILLWFERKDARIDLALAFMIVLFVVSWLLAPSQAEIRKMKEIAAMNELNPEWNQAGTDVVLQDRDIKEYEAERRKKLEKYAYAELMEKYLGGGSLSVMEFQYAGPFAETLTNLYHTAAPINEMAEKTAKKLMALNLQIEEAEEEIASLKEAGKMRRR